MPETDPGVAQAPTSLVAKLLDVARAIDGIEKGGRNEHHQYDYVQAVDVVRRVRTLLYERGILVFPGTVPGSASHSPAIGGRGMVTTVDLLYRFHDVDTGQQVVIPWTGAGADTGGDKGLYKAYTGGLKYALLSTFLIPTGDDPEGDRTTEGGHDSQAADAERPAATRIPIDRAKAIADSAVAAGLATWGEDGALVMTPVLKAKMADVGPDKVALLNVDQAETVEAFIAAEAGGAS